MPIPVNLSDVVDEMQMTSDESTVYLNRKTGEFVLVSHESASLIEDGEDWDGLPDWERDEMPAIKEALESPDYISLPSKFEIHEWSIMDEFCRSLHNEVQAEALSNAIRGRGAFRYFKDTVHRFGIAKDWYAFRDEAFREVAREWLSAHDVPFVEDRGDESAKED